MTRAGAVSYSAPRVDRSVTIPAPAKVNLHLEVRGSRADGYHDLLSLFVAVSLADTLRVRRAGPAGSFRLRGRFDVPAAANLVTRAVEAFRAETGVRDGLVAEVEKRIPAGSGLGGGSSDAAATLRALEALFAVALAPARRRALAESLGSDVPFFLEAAAALVEGRGERVQPLAPRTDFALVLVLPGVAVRTAEAFAWLDSDLARTGTGGEPHCHERSCFMPGKTRPRSPGDSAMTSTASFSAVFAVLRELRDGLLAAGASAARLTGSGSGLIGICRGRDEAEECARGLTAALPRAAPAARVQVVFPLASLTGFCYNRSMRIRQGEATHGDNGYSHQEGRG